MKTIVATLALCAVLMASSASASSEACKICTVVMTYVDSQLEKNATQEEVTQALERVCSEMPGSFQDQCKHFVIQYSEVVFHYIKVLSPSEICARLHLCPASVAVDSPQNTEYCAICRLVLTVVEHYVTKQSTVEEVEQVLDKVCAKLPSSISQECTTLINEYGAAAIKFITGEVSPQKACAALRLCPESKTLRLRHL